MSELYKIKIHIQFKRKRFVIYVSRYSRNLSQLNKPIENSSMLYTYIRVKNEDFTITLVGLYISLIILFQMKGHISFYFLRN